MYFHSQIRYAIIFWGNSVSSSILRLQKRALRILAGVNCGVSFFKRNVQMSSIIAQDQVMI